MDTKSELIQGLQSSPKYLPIWYRYDKIGSSYNDRCLAESDVYYFHKSEISCISDNVTEMIGQLKIPCMLVDMGSGNSVKTRMFINALLQKQSKLTYLPIDISSDYLAETSDALSKLYGERLDVKPIAGDFYNGINKLRQIPGPKFIIWLSGIFMLPFKGQVDILRCLHQTMTDNDNLLISFDVTQDKEQILAGYNGSLDLHYHLYINALCRLNRDFGSNINLDQFQLETKVVMSTADDISSNVLHRAKAKCDLSYPIPGLGITITLKKGEYINLYEGEGSSGKHTEKQIQTLVNQAGLKLPNIWISKDNHAYFCCLTK